MYFIAKRLTHRGIRLLWRLSAHIWFGRVNLLCAQVAELVDALASGASGHYGRGSSSLLLGTK